MHISSSTEVYTCVCGIQRNKQTSIILCSTLQSVLCVFYTCFSIIEWYEDFGVHQIASAPLTSTCWSTGGVMRDLLGGQDAHFHTHSNSFCVCDCVGLLFPCTSACVYVSDWV